MSDLETSLVTHLLIHNLHIFSNYDQTILPICSILQKLLLSIPQPSLSYVSVSYRIAIDEDFGKKKFGELVIVMVLHMTFLYDIIT